MTIQWVTPPSTLTKRINEYGKKVLAAVQAVAAYWGQLAQDDSRRNAPWTDRTGNARSGLFFAVDGFGLPPIIGQVSAEALQNKTDVAVEAGNDNTLIITLGHTVYYGKFLELKNGGAYAVIMSTIEVNLPQLERMLNNLLRG